MFLGTHYQSIKQNKKVSFKDVSFQRCIHCERGTAAAVD
jgi:hypothetical protein